MKIKVSKVVEEEVTIDEFAFQDAFTDYLKNYYWDILLDYGDTKTKEAFKEVYSHFTDRDLDTRAT